MSIRKIVLIGNPILRQKTDQLDFKETQTDDFISLIEDMIDTMRQADGVGLAAPQIGINKRVFVAETGNGPIALINAEITRRSKKMVEFEEGCLSIPNKFGKVLRHQMVKVSAFTLTGQPITFEAKGFFARVMQHEIDHLDGILYIDHLKESRV